MDLVTLPRKQNFSLEDDLHTLESTMGHFGLRLAISRQHDGQYRELLYETVGKGGIIAQYRLDDTPKLSLHLGQVHKSNLPLEKVPRVVEADNVLYSLGMDSDLFNSIWNELLR